MLLFRRGNHQKKEKVIESEWLRVQTSKQNHHALFSEKYCADQKTGGLKILARKGPTYMATVLSMPQSQLWNCKTLW